MALKTTMKRIAGELRDRGLQGVQAVVERQERVLAKRHYDGFLLDRQNRRSRNGGTRPVIHRGLALLPLGDGLRVDAVAPRKSPHALLTMLYRSTDRRCRAGAPVKNLSHSASFHPLGKNAPPNAGTKHLVPGLTGWAQINGRDELPIPVKVQFDYEYLQRRSFKFDLYIIYKTAFKVVCGDGIQH